MLINDDITMWGVFELFVYNCKMYVTIYLYLQAFCLNDRQDAFADAYREEI